MPGIGEKELLRLKHDGVQSDILDLRLRYAEADSTRKYLALLVGLDRVHCQYLPTQKSGRWSTTKPPLPNFSANCINPRCSRAGVAHRTGGECWSLRDLVVPEPGYWFLHWDWEAIEAKLAAAYSGDDEDLDLFSRGADIHTWTLCSMFGMPRPQNVMNPYKAPEDEAWRQITGLFYKDTWRRTAAKTCRFSLAYGADERAIHQAKDIDKLARLAGLDKAGVEAMAKAYLESKPKLRAWKRRVWDQIMKTQEVRTPLGRRKRLFVSSEEYVSYKKTGRATAACKEGLNHLAQGQVADMMNLTLIAIKRQWPECRLAYQAHDGLTTVWPESSNPWPVIREVVERTWDMGNGRMVKSTAEFERIGSDGEHRGL